MPAAALPRLARAYGHETLLWAAEGHGRTFEYGPINRFDPASRPRPSLRPLRSVLPRFARNF